MNSYDIIIQQGTLFDGTGGACQIVDIGIKNGVVAEISTSPIKYENYPRIIEAKGKWITPGFIDIHTHYDAEVEISPGLIESVRHGVTSVVLGSCSLSMVSGNANDLADMFCRVEGIPSEVVKPLFEKIKDWDGPTEYLNHLSQLNLGPNIACLLGHSTIRASVMGMKRALTKGLRPNSEELKKMDDLLEEALDVGFVGLSISTLPWDKMDGDEFRSRPMPSVFSSWKEYRHLAKQLRKRGKVLQAVPNISTKLNVPLFLTLSTGLFRKALKTTIISMMDVRSDRYAFRIAGILSRFFNFFLKADFKMQALPEVFDLWGDGIDLVVFEEFEAGAAALHLKDVVERKDLLDDKAYRKKFKREWRRKIVPKAFHRDFNHSKIISCPDLSVVGKSFEEIAKEKKCDVIDIFLDLIVAHGDQLRWFSVMGNDRPDWLKWIVAHPDILIGFSDAGAHLRNMAHYNFPLRLLKMVRDSEQDEVPFMSVSKAVHRLTYEIAEWFDLDAGLVKVGRRADLVVIDPTHLDQKLEQIHEVPMPGFTGLNRLVRRNDDAVSAVLINGKIVFENGIKASQFGHEQGYGTVLRAGQYHEISLWKKISYTDHNQVNSFSNDNITF